MSSETLEIRRVKIGGASFGVIASQYVGMFAKPHTYHVFVSYRGTHVQSEIASEFYTRKRVAQVTSELVEYLRASLKNKERLYGCNI